jgi:methionine-rich copper-binding protein CopC
MRLARTLATLLVLAAGTAHAHTHLQSSLPADRSTVASPREVTLHFSAAARLTALTLQRGGEAPLNLAVPAKSARDFSVPVSAVSAGSYKVTWRAAGEDGHVMSGSFSFTVDPAAPASSPKP